MAKPNARRLAQQATEVDLCDMTEDQWQAWVVAKATACGWRLQFHVRRAQVKGRWLTNTSTPGVPDLWLLRPETGQLVVLELKVEHDRTDPARRLAQAGWIAGLQRVPGVEAYIVRPSDATDVLTLLARPRS